MAVPTVASVGPLTPSVDPVTVTMPSALMDDCLVLAVQSLSGPPPTIANAAGGTWTAAGPFSGSNGNGTVRLTVFTSRYNGTQTAPTLTDTGDHQAGQIIAVRGCDWTSGTPLNAVAGDAPTFAETISNVIGITTTVVNCLVIDIIAGSQPDADGSGMYSAWANSDLTGLTEIADASTGVGAGGSLAWNVGTKTSAGTVGTTAVTHGNWAVAYKKLALAGTAGIPVQGYSTDTSVSPPIATFQGSQFFIRLAYSSGSLSNFSDQSITLELGPGSLLENARLTHYLNYQWGPLSKVIDQCTPLPFPSVTMGALATGNALTNNPLPIPPPPTTTNLAVVDNPDVNGTPFRTLWDTLPNAGPWYLADEPQAAASNAAVLNSILYYRNVSETEMPHQPRLYVLFPEGPLTCETTAGSGVESQFGSAGFTEHLLSVANPYWWNRNLPHGGNDWIGDDIYVNFRNENLPISQGGCATQGGFPRFLVADRAAFSVAAAIQSEKVPIIILQFFGPFQQGRFPNADECWYDMICCVAEGARGIGWWNIGTNGAGLLAQVDPLKTQMAQVLIAMTQHLASNEAALLSTPKTGWTNSTVTGNALNWRKGILPVVANGSNNTSFGNGGRAIYQAELNALNAGVVQWSPMLDQSGNVRMRVFQKDATTYLVYAYNYHPSPTGTVTFTAPFPITQVISLDDSRTITPSGANTWQDVLGGASSLLQGPNRPAHVYRVSTSATPQNPIMLAAGSSYAVTGTATTLQQQAGPTLIGFVWRR